MNRLWLLGIRPSDKIQNDTNFLQRDSIRKT